MAWRVACGCLAALALAVGAAGCSATMGDYASEEALTVSAPVQGMSSLDVPKRFFDEVLPARFQHNGLGFINDQETFLKMWRMYASDAMSLPPSIDFEDVVMLFAYDPEYYNLASIRQLRVWHGIANPVIERTDWKLKIGGDPKMREIRAQRGEPVPEPKVNVAFLQVPRNKPGRPGVTALLVGEDPDDAEDSPVLPIPEKP